MFSYVNQRKYQSSASLALSGEIHQWLIDSPHKGPVTRKMFPFDDVIMNVAALAFTHKFETRVGLQNHMIIRESSGSYEKEMSSKFQGFFTVIGVMHTERKLLEQTYMGHIRDGCTHWCVCACVLVWVCWFVWVFFCLFVFNVIRYSNIDL